MPSAKTESSESKSGRLPLVVVALAAAVFIAITLLHNYRFYQNFCADGFDFSIYLELIKKIAQGSWNPFLETLQRHQLSDHSDPIYYLVSWLNWILPLQWTGWILEVGFVALCAGVLIWLVNRGFLGAWVAALLACYFFFSRDLYEATFYPIHSSTFALLPVVIIAGFIASRDWLKPLSRREIVILAVLLFFLCLFKETVTPMALGLSLALILVPRHHREGLLLTLIFLPVSWFFLKGRALFVGPLHDQLSRVVFSPSGVAELYDWDLGQLNTVFKYLLSLLPLLWFAFVSRAWTAKNVKIKVFVLAGFFLPHLLGQTLSGSFSRHYNTMLVAFLLALGIVLIRSEKVSAKAATVACVFFFVFGISKFKRAVFFTENHNFIPSCVHSMDAYSRIQERNSRLRADVDLIKAETGNRSLSIISNGNLLPQLVSEIPNIRAIHIGLIPVSFQDVDWIFVEYGDYGYPPPAGPGQDWAGDFEKVVKESGGHVIEHRDGIFLARGPVHVYGINKIFTMTPSR